MISVYDLFKSKTYDKEVQEKLEYYGSLPHKSTSFGAIRNEENIKLFIADENKDISGDFIELDVATSFNYNTANKTTSHPVENKKVFIDGVVKQLGKIVIEGYIIVDKVEKLQSYAQPDVWFYIYYNKPVGQTFQNQKAEYVNGALYHISSLDISDEGYYNSLYYRMQIEEVRTYSYKYSSGNKVSHTNPETGSGLSDNGSADGGIEYKETYSSWVDKFVNFLGGGS